ncbi:MAG TPA: response regulator [Rectinemataceae bacterium]|nr:response regulator [Rectinemataceae bacterium]
MDAKVLVVDDSIVARMSLRATLKDLGTETTEARSGEEALALVEAGLAPDVVFLDLTMPGLGGIETLRRLVATRSSLPIIVVTADLQEGTREEVRREGGFDIVRKPADPAIVRDALSRALGGRSRS